MELLHVFRDFAAEAPPELQCYPFVLRVPPVEPFPAEWHGRLVLDFVCFHLDPAAEAALEPLRDLGETVLEVVGPAPYTAVQQAFDAGLPACQRYHSKSHFLDDLSDRAIDAFAAGVAGMEGTFSAAYLEPPAPAVVSVDESATAFAGRARGFGLHVLAGWSEPGDDDAAIAWAKGFHVAMAPHASSWVYVNLLGADERHRVAAAYGDHYPRLAELKAVWDADNVFRANHNIEPAR